MRYHKAYLHPFNRLTEIIETLEKLDPETEQVDTRPLLKAVQAEAEAEQICIER